MAFKNIVYYISCLIPVTVHDSWRTKDILWCWHQPSSVVMISLKWITKTKVIIIFLFNKKGLWHMDTFEANNTHNLILWFSIWLSLKVKIPLKIQVKKYDPLTPQSKGPGARVGDVKEGSSIMTVISRPRDTQTLTDKCQGAGGTYSVRGVFSRQRGYPASPQSSAR